MHQRFEGQIKAADQTELFYQTWTPEKVRGVFVITHGLAEHSECYHPLARILAEDGWLVYGWDMRGHGRSEGKRGFVRHLNYYVDDLEVMLRHVRMQHPEFKPVIFAHSLGALVTLRLLQSRRIECSALTLSSPALGIAVAVPQFKQKLARVAQKWMPSLTMFNEIRYEDLSHDEEMLRSYRTDTLRHDKISPGLFLSMLECFPLALQDAEQLTMPVLMQLSGEDKIVSAEASRTLFERLPNKKNQLIVYQESFHEIYNDREREQVIADLKKFIHPYLGA